MILTKYELLQRDSFMCQNPKCNKIGNIDTLQIAHRVKQGSGSIKTVQNFIERKYNKVITKKQAKDIINDEQNVVIACPLCNSGFNIYFKTKIMEQKIIDIYEKEYK